MGNYDLASDAALAYDEAIKCIEGPDADTNFDTDQEYQIFRAKELKVTGLDVDLDKTRAYISTKLDDFITKALASDDEGLTVESER